MVKRHKQNHIKRKLTFDKLKRYPRMEGILVVLGRGDGGENESNETMQ